MKPQRTLGKEKLEKSKIWSIHSKRPHKSWSRINLPNLTTSWSCRLEMKKSCPKRLKKWVIRSKKSRRLTKNKRSKIWKSIKIYKTSLTWFCSYKSNRLCLKRKTLLQNKIPLLGFSKKQRKSLLNSKNRQKKQRLIHKKRKNKRLSELTRMNQPILRENLNNKQLLLSKDSRRRKIKSLAGESKNSETLSVILPRISIRLDVEKIIKSSQSKRDQID